MKDTSVFKVTLGSLSKYVSTVVVALAKGVLYSLLPKGPVQDILSQCIKNQDVMQCNRGTVGYNDFNSAFSNTMVGISQLLIIILLKYSSIPSLLKVANSCPMYKKSRCYAMQQRHSWLQ